MKTPAEWSNDFFFGKKIGTIAELVKEVREEMAEEAAKKAEHGGCTESRCYSESGERIHGDTCPLGIAEAIRQLKEKP